MAERHDSVTTPTGAAPAGGPEGLLSDDDLAKVSGGTGAGLVGMEVEPVDFKPKSSLMGLQVEPVDFKPRPGF